MNYEEMSDLRINDAIAKFQGEQENRISKYSDKIITLCDGVVVDYCNYPLDGWPILVEGQIDLLFDKYSGDGCTAIGTSSKIDKYGCSTLECTDSNPLRAAMIVYLKMKESES